VGEYRQCGRCGNFHSARGPCAPSLPPPVVKRLAVYDNVKGQIMPARPLDPKIELKLEENIYITVERRTKDGKHWTSAVRLLAHTEVGTNEVTLDLLEKLLAEARLELDQR
jgi:hypothetical protein